MIHQLILDNVAMISHWIGEPAKSKGEFHTLKVVSTGGVLHDYQRYTPRKTCEFSPCVSDSKLKFFDIWGNLVVYWASSVLSPFEKTQISLICQAKLFDNSWISGEDGFNVGGIRSIDFEVEHVFEFSTFSLFLDDFILGNFPSTP